MEEVVVVVSYPPEPFSLEVLGFESSVWVVGFEVSFWVFAGLIKALLSSQAPSFFAFACELESLEALLKTLRLNCRRRRC